MHSNEMLGDSLGSGQWSPITEEPALVLEDIQRPTNTLAKLNTLRKEGQLCDVTMQVGRATFPAHRAVLACLSGSLMELFTEEEGGSRSHFKLPHVNVDAFQILVNYAYTSRLEVPEDQIINVYKTATTLKVPWVAQACSEYLAKNLTLSNCLAIRGFANSTSHAELTRATDVFIQEHIRELVDTPAFATLPNMLFDIVGVHGEEVEESGEDSIGQVLLTWLKNALSEQKFSTFTENPHVLYLTGDNMLRDCLNLAEDDINRCSETERQLVDKIHNCDVVQDYVKLSRRKQV